MGGSAHLSFSMGALMAAGGAFAFASMLSFTFVSLSFYQTSIFWHTSADIFCASCMWETMIPFDLCNMAAGNISLI
jgi:hypothetical protein